MYNQGELLTEQAVEFYPNFAEAVSNAIRAGFDSLLIAFSGTALELGIRRETESGSGDYTEGLKGVAEQRATFESISIYIKETPLIPAMETRRHAIVKEVDQQVAAFEVAEQALEVGDKEAILKAIGAIKTGSETDWYENFTAVVNESGDIAEELSTLAEKLNKAIEEL